MRGPFFGGVHMCTFVLSMHFYVYLRVYACLCWLAIRILLDGLVMWQSRFVLVTR